MLTKKRGGRGAAILLDVAATVAPLPSFTLACPCSHLPAFKAEHKSGFLGHLGLTTGIPMGFPMGMETHRSELLVIMGLHGSGCLFWAASTCETEIF